MTAGARDAAGPARATRSVEAWDAAGAAIGAKSAQPRASFCDTLGRGWRVDLIPTQGGDLGVAPACAPRRGARDWMGSPTGQRRTPHSHAPSTAEHRRL